MQRQGVPRSYVDGNSKSGRSSKDRGGMIARAVEALMAVAMIEAMCGRGSHVTVALFWKAEAGKMVLVADLKLVSSVAGCAYCGI